MTEYVLPPPPIAAVPVDGTDGHLPIHRIFCVGRNYEAHAREMGGVADREAPFYFMKSSQHYAPSGSAINYPPGTANYQYEMELVVAIGAPAHAIAREDAQACIFGYACGLDMTRRDLQVAARERQRPWDLGKNFEHAAVIAPIVPAARSGHLSHGAIELRVNGEVRQSSDIGLMVHDVAAIVADLSRFYHLEPGDLVFTGTPEGVGPVHPGDRLVGRIEGLIDIKTLIR